MDLDLVPRPGLRILACFWDLIDLGLNYFEEVIKVPIPYTLLYDIRIILRHDVLRIKMRRYDVP